MADKYNWNFCSLGGVTRVVINNGEDIAHLRELDQKLWTALSCPTNGLEFDPTTLRILDGDGDGKIRVQEVIAAAEWLTSIIKDKDSILKGEDSLPLDQFNTENEVGAKLHNSAAQILRNLGLEKDSISISDTADSIAIFKNTRFLHRNNFYSASFHYLPDFSDFFFIARSQNYFFHQTTSSFPKKFFKIYSL